MWLRGVGVGGEAIPGRTALAETPKSTRVAVGLGTTASWLLGPVK